MKLAKKPMNGRVIKQLIRGAQAIAIAKKEPFSMTHVSKQLIWHISYTHLHFTKTQLQKVVGITEKFESDWKALALEDDLEGDAAGKKDRERTMYS
jgi:hypothetical protein